MPSDLAGAAAGLLAAGFWGAGDFGGGMAARRLPVFLALLGSQVTGLVGALAIALVVGAGVPSPGDAAWAAVAAAFGAIGLAGLYRALADGRMGIVAPITGVLTAAIPVAIGLATGGLPGPMRLAGFAVAIVAIVLVSMADDGTTGRGGLLLAIGAGTAFGLYGACFGQVEGAVFPALAVARATGSAIVLAIVLATRVPLRTPFRGRPRLLGLVVLVGLLDLVGNAAYLVGVQVGGLALAASLGSLYPVATVVLAAVVLHEPIGRVHAAGIAAAAVAAVMIVGGA